MNFCFVPVPDDRGRKTEGRMIGGLVPGQKTEHLDLRTDDRNIRRASISSAHCARVRHVSTGYR